MKWYEFFIALICGSGGCCLALIGAHNDISLLCFLAGALTTANYFIGRFIGAINEDRLQNSCNNRFR